GGSGVGTAAIQLAKQLKSANVITTAGSEEKLQFAKSIGADTLINYKEQDFSEVIQEATAEQGANVFLDFIGAPYWKKNLASISIDGRWVLIGVLGGNTVSRVKHKYLMT